MSAPITITGNLAADPEITFAKTGTAIARFRVATSRRTKQGDEWKDTEVTFWRCKAFKKLAENIGDSLTKGSAVIVTGRAFQEEWETPTGEKRATTQIIADHVGLDLTRGTYKPGNTTTNNADPWDTKTQSADMPF